MNLKMPKLPTADIIPKRRMPVDRNGDYPPQIADLNDPRSYAPPRLRGGAAAAAAAQQWEEMEQDLNAKHVALQQAQAQVLTLEESSKLIREEIRQVRAENERLIRENTSIHSRLRAAADVLVGLLKAEPSLSEEAERQGQEAVERALAPHNDPHDEAEIR